MLEQRESSRRRTEALGAARRAGAQVLLATVFLLASQCAFKVPEEPRAFACDDSHPCPGSMACVASACIDPDLGITPCPPEFLAGGNWLFDSFEDPTCDEQRDRNLVRWKVNAEYGTNGWFSDRAFETGQVAANGLHSCLVPPPDFGAPRLRWYAFSDDSGEGGYINRQVSGRVCISARVRMKDPGPERDFHLDVFKMADSNSDEVLLQTDFQQVSRDRWTHMMVQKQLDTPIYLDVKIYPTVPTGVSLQTTAFYVDDVFIGFLP